MKSFLLPIALLASAAMAQTTSECAAAYIVEACLEGENAKLAACGNNDYECKCNGWKNIITCFNNCPNDSRLHESAGQRDIFCDYASRFPSTTTQVAAATTTPSGSTPAQTTTSSDDANNDDATETESDEAASTTTNSPPNGTNSAADLALNAGGLLAAVAGVVAVVL